MKICHVIKSPGNFYVIESGGTICRFDFVDIPKLCKVQGDEANADGEEVYRVMMADDTKIFSLLTAQLLNHDRWWDAFSWLKGQLLSVKYLSKSSFVEFIKEHYPVKYKLWCEADEIAKEFDKPAMKPFIEDLFSRYPTKL